MANKNTRQARKRGFASLYDMNKGAEGTKLVKGVCVDTRRLGRRRWMGAAAASKANGRAD